MMKPVRALLALFAFYLACNPVCALAQATAESKIQEPVIVETIAVLPWNFLNGTEGAKRTGKEFLSTVLTKIKVDAVSEVKTLAAWEQVNTGEYQPKDATLPSPAEMLRVGTKLSTDWVMAGSADWHSRGLWIGLGPKTKSTCTVSARIVDVKKQIVAGIRAHYTPESLVGRQIIIVNNLQPAMLRGEESQGMLLAASEGDSVVLLRPDRDLPSGARVK